MRCPHCNYENRSFDARCYRCGEELVDPESLPLSRSKPRPGPGKYGYGPDRPARYEEDAPPSYGEVYDEPHTQRASRSGYGRPHGAPRDPDTLYGEVVDMPAEPSWKAGGRQVDRQSDPRRPMSQAYDREPERAVTVRPDREVTYRPGGLSDANENLFDFDEGEKPTQRRALSRIRRTEPEAGDKRMTLRAQDRQKCAGTMLTRKEQKVFASGEFERSRTGRGAVKFVALSLIAVCVVAAALFGAKSLADADILPAVLDGGKAAASDLVGPTIEQAEVDGQACHVLTFTGQEDEYIYIPELKRNYKIIQGIAKVTLKDADWIGEEPESGSVEVVLNPVLYTSVAKQKPMSQVTFTINVPSSPLTILSPGEGGATTYNSMYLLKIKVEKDSEVLISGESVSDLIDDEGIITYNVAVEAKGDNRIPIRVKTRGYRATVATAVINRPYMEIPLEVSPNTPTVHQSKTISITGKVAPGATLTIKPAAKEDVRIDENGDFTFDVSLSGYGENVIELTASMPGKQDSVITHTVNFMPKLDVYSSGAWPLSTQKQYDELIQCYATSFKGKAFKCTGTIAEMIDPNDPMKFFFNVAPQGEEPRLIVIEMVSEKPCREGVKYDIYADVAGDYEGNPLLIGRYRIEKE